MDHDDPEVTAALNAFRAVFDSVRARPDNPAKFHAVSQFTDGAQKLRDEGAAERREVVRRYRDANQFALSRLGRELDISKTRAWQLASRTEDK